MKLVSIALATYNGEEFLESQLESFANLTLMAYSESHYYDEIDMSSRFTLNLLMDLVIIEYIKQHNK